MAKKQSKIFLSLDLTAELEKIQTFKVTQLDEFEAFLYDLCDKGYDAFDYMSDKLTKDIKTVTKEKAGEMLIDLKRIKQQTTKLLNILEPMDYETKIMYRALNMYENIETDSEDFIKQIKKLLKKG